MNFFFTLIQLRSLRHENINCLIGYLCHAQKPAIVYDFCSRGGLYEIIHQADLNLDWEFRFSLITDLVRVTKFHIKKL